VAVLTGLESKAEEFKERGGEIYVDDTAPTK
jgi:hypothetical protein